MRTPTVPIDTAGLRPVTCLLQRLARLGPRIGICFVWAALAFPAPAACHMSIIRQGLESAQSLESGDETGSELATGDFNNDGYEDLAIGAPKETLGGQTAAGVVIIVYGSPVGLVPAGAQSRTATSVGGTNLPFAEFGHALAAGHFDDDAYADLAIGDPFDTVGAADDAGRVFILRGGPAGLSGTAAVILDQSDGGGSVEAGDQFGAALAVGDFNGDGRDDLAIGSPGEDTDAGAVFHFYGSATGITTTGAGFFKQSSLGGTNISGDRFGFSLAAGNLYGTVAHADLAVGAPYRNVAGLAGAGVVYLIQGSAAGLTTANRLQYDARNKDGAHDSAWFGYSLAVGNFYDDTYSALAIGEPQWPIGLLTHVGRVLIVPGQNAGLDWSSVEMESQGPGYATVLEQGDSFGIALAAGHWDDDAYEDLAVGIPFEDTGPSSESGSIVDAGAVQILRGGSSFVGAADTLVFFQHNIFDDSETGDQLGAAVAFGRFDDSGRASLAVGAPKEDTSADIKYDDPTDGYRDAEEFVDAGCVYIVAPWRQPRAGRDMPCRSSVATDCSGNLVFSQRPFDRVRPASTTKVMTMLLACEHIQAGTADSNYVYLVPNWVACGVAGGGGVGHCVGGSVLDMVPGEQWNLLDIIYYTISQSGNDGAYAIADIVSYRSTGRVADPFDVSDFVAEMNSRASDLGMLRTQFANPAGRDTTQNAALAIQDNYTTANDMAILGRAAMQNPLFREILDWRSRSVILNRGAVFPRRRLYNKSGMIVGIQALLGTANGIKTGSTTWTGRSRLVSAQSALLGLVVGGMYAIHPSTPSDNGLHPILVELLNLGFDLCDPSYVYSPPAHAIEGPLARVHGASTQSGAELGTGVEIETTGHDSLVVEAHRDAGTQPAHFHIDIRRDSRATLAPGAIGGYRIQPFESHQGFIIENEGQVPATLQISRSYPPGTSTYVVPPGGSLGLPGASGGASGSFDLSIRNLASQQDARLVVHERGYGFDVTLDPAGPFFGALLPQLSAPQTASPVSVQHVVLTALGQDTGPGSLVQLLVRRASGVVTAVGEVETSPASTPLLVAGWAWPNPFRTRTQIAFELSRGSRVDALLFDVRGRLVRRLGGREFSAGTGYLDWDGRNQSGETLAHGLYFYELRAKDGPVRRGRLILVR